jgi:type I restriction enzyme S subunit
MTAAEASPLTVESDLPEGWLEANFLDVIDYEGGAQPPKKQFVYEPRKGYVRLIQIRDFGPKPFPTFVPDSSRLKKATENDLLLARYGGDSADDSLGRICTGLAGAYNVALVKLKFSEHLNREFVRLFFKGSWFKSAISINSRSCQRGFNRDDLRWLKFPLAPRGEQTRIAEKAKELLNHIDAVRERLVHVPTVLKRFRQAVLAAACSGRLTAEWRRGADISESSDCFIKEILSERDAKWERGRLKPPVAYEDSELSDLPEGWTWRSFDTFVTDSFYGPRFAENEYSDKGVPTIRTTDISFDGSITLKDAPCIALNKDDTKKFGLIDGDLLITRTGATIGKCAIYDKRIGPAIPSAYLIRFRLTRNSVPPKFLLIFLMSPQGQKLLVRRSTAVAQPNVNATSISRFAVPLPPRQEIDEILHRVEALFKLTAAIEKRMAAATARAEKLTQAILAKAFRGELVPTEAELARHEGRDYEPASALLARIRAEHNHAVVANTATSKHR